MFCKPGHAETWLASWLQEWLVLMAGQTIRRQVFGVAVAAVLAMAVGQLYAVSQGAGEKEYVGDKERLAAIRRGHVWVATKVRSMNIRTGPAGPGAFRAGVPGPS